MGPTLDGVDLADTHSVEFSRLRVVVTRSTGTSKCIDSSNILQAIVSEQQSLERYYSKHRRRSDTITVRHDGWFVVDMLPWLCDYWCSESNEVLSGIVCDIVVTDTSYVTIVDDLLL